MSDDRPAPSPASEQPKPKETEVIQTMPAPCWRLVNANGISHDSGDGTAHYDSEAEAQAHAAELADYYSGLTPKQYAELCVNVRCNGCKEALDDGIWSDSHFESQADAREIAEACDWVTELGPNVRHADCVPAEVSAR